MNVRILTLLLFSAVISSGHRAVAQDAPAEGSLRWTTLYCGTIQIAVVAADAAGTLCGTLDHRTFLVAQVNFSPSGSIFLDPDMGARWVRTSIKAGILNVHDDGSILGIYTGVRGGGAFGFGAEVGWFRKYNFDEQRGEGSAVLINAVSGVTGPIAGGGFVILPYPRVP